MTLFSIVFFFSFIFFLSFVASIRFHVTTTNKATDSRSCRFDSRLSSSIDDRFCFSSAKRTTSAVQPIGQFQQLKRKWITARPASAPLRRLEIEISFSPTVAEWRPFSAASRGTESSTDLGDEGLETGADLASRQVSGSGDELDPERHGALAAVAELEDGAAGQRAVVDKVEDAHLVEVEHHFELVGRDDLEALEAAVALGQRRDEARLLHFDLLEHVLHHFAHFAQRLGDLTLARLYALAVKLVQLVQHLGLGRHHIRRHQHGGGFSGLVFSLWWRLRRIPKSFGVEFWCRLHVTPAAVVSVWWRRGQPEVATRIGHCSPRSAQH